MKDKPTNEDKILAEIRRRVLDFESRNQEKEDLESLRKANIQALDEMSSLNEQEIMRIASQVRKEHELKVVKEKQRKILIWAVAVLVLFCSALFFIARQQSLAEREAYLANKLIEKFDDNKRNWLFFNDIKYNQTIENGGYIIETGDGSCYWDKAAISLPSHYAVELTSTWQRGEEKSEYGLALVQENDDVIAFSLDAEGKTYYGHHKSGKWEKTSDWSKKIGHPEREENLQRVEIKDNSSFKYFLNGKLAFEDTFSRTVPTQVGMRSCGKQKIDFQSIKVINLVNNKVVFEDNFNDANSIKWNPQSQIAKTSKIENGKYILETNQDDYCDWATQSYQITEESSVDIILKANHIKGETDNFGLIISQDDSNYYTFDFKSDGKARRNFYQIDKWTYTGNYKETIILSSKNDPAVTLKVEIRNRDCKYFVNGILIERFELDYNFKIYNVGLRCCGKQQIAFDELQIIPK